MFVQQRVVAGKRRSRSLKLPDLSMRRGSSDDLQAVYRLNQQVFDPGWSVAALYSALDSGYDLIVCEQGGMLAGYLLSLQVVDEIQIMQIAVHETCRRQGLAAAMSEYLLQHCKGAVLVTLEVRSSNLAARSLYAQLGFEQVGVRRKYYAPDAAGFCEDAVLMSKPLV